MKNAPIRAAGIAWFRPEDYDRCRQLFIDGDKLAETYQEWHRAAQRAFDQFTAAGHLVERAYLDPETFPAWCTARGLQIDANARMQFANEAVDRKYANQS